MSDPTPDLSATEAALVLLSDYRKRRREFHVLDDYDRAMERMRNKSSQKTVRLQEPMRSIASRLSSITDKGFFLFHLYQWKLDYVADALIYAIEAKNPISLANNTRSLLEHLAALVAVMKELQYLHERLLRQGNQTAIEVALAKAETFLHRAYYGKNEATKKAERAIHVNDYLRILKEEVPDVLDIYDYLCEYVHPNHGSNVLVSTGELGRGRLNPSEEVHRETLDRLRRYCSLAMIFLKTQAIKHAAVFIALENLVELCCTRGAKVSSVFSKRSPKPTGDGKSQETAYFFPSARTSFEAIGLCSAFLEQEGYQIVRRANGGVIDEFVYDVYETSRGLVWFKVRMI